MRARDRARRAEWPTWVRWLAEHHLAWLAAALWGLACLLLVPAAWLLLIMSALIEGCRHGVAHFHDEWGDFIEPVFKDAGRFWHLVRHGLEKETEEKRG
jgi:hypothetical protein